ncbi:MAG: hypothetical protein CK425_01990 [Parachlamydia sp.]|nr:MAG: hypothetical protein CK425_01990 [Parachlamydia sp.]
MEPSREYNPLSSWSMSFSENTTTSQVTGKRKDPEVSEDGKTQPEAPKTSSHDMLAKTRAFFIEFENKRRKAEKLRTAVAQTGSLNDLIHATSSIPRVAPSSTLNPRQLHHHEAQVLLTEDNNLIAALKANADGDSIRELLASGSKIAKRDQDGRNAFHHAAMKGDEEICKILLDQVAQFDANSILSCFGRLALNTQDALGHTPLTYAFKHSVQQAFAFIAAGANFTNADGASSIDLDEFCDLLHVYEGYHRLQERQPYGQQHIAALLTKIFENILHYPHAYSPAHIHAAKMWTGFAGTSEECLQALFKDVVVACANEDMHIPQLFVEILKVQSDYFRGLLNGSFRESTRPDELSLKSMDSHNFRIILRMLFAVSDQEKDFDNFLELIENIKFLGINKLTAEAAKLLSYKCRQIFCEDESSRTEAFAQIAHILDFAKAFELPAVQEAALFYIQRKSNCGEINDYFSKSHEDFEQFHRVIEAMRHVPIENLDLVRGYLTDAVIEELSHISSLTRLTFSKCAFLLSDEAIQKLIDGRLLPNLRILSFSDSEGDLEGLKKLQEAKKFNLQTKEQGKTFYTHMTQAFSEDFTVFQKSVERNKNDPIPELDFADGKLESRGLQEISKIASLERLTFKGCRVKLNDRTLKRLKDGILLPNLKSIHFLDCHISPSMKAKLSIERLSISFSQPTKKSPGKALY